MVWRIYSVVHVSIIGSLAWKPPLLLLLDFVIVPSGDASMGQLRGSQTQISECIDDPYLLAVLNLCDAAPRRTCGGVCVFFY